MALNFICGEVPLPEMQRICSALFSVPPSPGRVVFDRFPSMGIMSSFKNN